MKEIVLPDGTRIQLTESNGMYVFSVLLGFKKTERGVFMDTCIQLRLTKEEAEAAGRMFPETKPSTLES